MAKTRDLIRAKTYVRHFGMEVSYLLPITFVAITVALPLNNDPGKTSLNIAAIDINFLRRYSHHNAPGPEMTTMKSDSGIKKLQRFDSMGLFIYNSAVEGVVEFRIT